MLSIQGDAVELLARLIRQILIFGSRIEFGPAQLTFSFQMWINRNLYSSSDEYESRESGRYQS
jgi:hypothetical protein